MGASTTPRERRSHTPGRALDLMLAAPAVAGAPAEHLSATLQRTPDQTVVAFFIAMLVVMLFAQLCGSLMPRLASICRETPTSTEPCPASR